jgi:hypothetical protein
LTFYLLTFCLLTFCLLTFCLLTFWTKKLDIFKGSRANCFAPTKSVTRRRPRSCS